MEGPIRVEVGYEADAVRLGIRIGGGGGTVVVGAAACVGIALRWRGRGHAGRRCDCTVR